MQFVDFHSRCPQTAEGETRTISIVSHKTLGTDTLAFAEAFCEDAECDCTRVYMYVHSKRRRRVIATLRYGWAGDVSGVDLPPLTYQDDFCTSEALKDMLANLVGQDAAYRERIKTHYYMFKKALLEEKLQELPAAPPVPPPPTRLRTRVGRNELCLCGSGRKYKKCCLAG